MTSLATTINPQTASVSEIKALIAETGLKHTAIIMDGNRRWAEDHKQPKLAGHSQGVKTLKKLVRYCGEVGLDALTVYAFSTENWRRTEDEVGYLMKLFVQALGEEVQELHENNVCLRFIGDLTALDPKLQHSMTDAMDLMKNNTGLKLQVAINYGSRAEQVHAIRSIVSKVREGKLDCQAVDEACIEQHLYTQGLPELDMLIRTGGEYRLSNYLLWQAAYAEFYVTDTLWPDFLPVELNKAVIEFSNRQRRFGQ